ncbi:MAG: RAM signaling network component [Trichoglossum hirsutum]|nr:MAG: RAM signaling network component [Trichoglossum hirsutum]
MELALGLPPQTSSTSSLVGDDPTTPRADQTRSHAQQVPSNSNVNISSSTIRYAPTQPAISAGRVVALAEEAIKAAREETQRSAAGGDAVANGDLKPGVTIDLGHKYIARIPDEMVDIIKDEIERLALSHNQISTFPDKFAECSRLRYLNIRSNFIREFPLAICQIPFLDILDISRNKLRVLPPEISNLTSLKVLSIQKNRIERLPQCLGDMNSLQVLKLDNNPIVFPPREVLEARELDIPSTATPNERDALFTAHLKRYLKQYVEKPETGESGEESSSDGTTELAGPMRPMKRVASGRFPIKVNSGNNTSNDSRSPILQRPPPVPQRSHARILSQQSSAFRRPGLSALPNGNERLRSNSESILANRANRQKRMGIITRKTSDLGTVDEGRLARLSHYRGLSHGSLMQGNSRSGNGSNGNSSSSPVSPTEVERHKGHYVRRLSSLPEYKRESHSPDAVVEGAKGILYALFQVHPHISNLISVVRDVNSKRSSLERVFYNAATHVDELDRELHKYDTYAEEDEEDMLSRSNEGVRRACITCVIAYQHVGMLLQRNVSKIILHGDQRYVRTLLLLVYGSLLEVRNACFSLSVTYRRKSPSSGQDLDGTIRPRASVPKPILAHAGRANTTEALVVPGAGINNVLSVPLSSNSVAGTPRSGEAFQVPSSQPHSRTNTMQGIEDPEEERLFERIFLVLRSATDKALNSLPTISDFFIGSVLQNKSQEGKTELDQLWTALNQLCLIAMERGRELKARLSTIKLMEPGIRSQRAFWELCNSFVKSFVDLALRVKEARSMSLIPNEILIILRQVQRLVKECGILIETSPWKYLAAPQYQQPQQPLTVPNLVMQAGFNSGGLAGPGPATSPPSPYVTPLPATPLSAALGPAVQATVPSMPMPQNTYGIFSGTVFERSDSLLSTPARSLTAGVTDGYNQTGGQGMPSTLLSPIGVRRT